MIVRKFHFYCLVTLLVTAGIILLLAAFNAQAVTAIQIKLKDNVQEDRDRNLLGIIKQRVLPDYQLKLRDHSGWHDLGTKRNTSAQDWLEYPVRKAVPYQHVLELQLFEDDRIRFELLDQVQVSGEAFASDKYQYRIVTGYRFGAGMVWFFDTPLGKAITAGIAIVVIVAILATWL